MSAAALHLVCQGALPYSIESLLSSTEAANVPRRLTTVAVVLVCLEFFESMTRRSQFLIIADLEAYIRLRLVSAVVAAGAFVDHARSRARDADGHDHETSTMVARIGTLCSDVCYAVISYVEGMLDAARLLVTSLFFVLRSPKYFAWGIIVLTGLVVTIRGSPKCTEAVALGETFHMANLDRIDDIYRHLPTVYLHQQEDDELRAFAEHTESLRTVGSEWRQCELHLAQLCTVWFIGLHAVLLVMQYQDYRHGRASLALMGVTLTYANYMAYLIQPWVESLSRYERILTRIRTQEKFFEALLAPPPRTPRVPVSALAAAAEVGFDGLVLDRISLRLPGSGRLLLEDCSWRVPRGRRVALLGPNGSGKSQLLWALLGWRQGLLAGRVVWRGREARLDTEEGLRAWRSQISFADQGADMLNRSVAENRFYGLGADPGADVDPAHSAQVATTLSGGQRQALVMARMVDHGRDLVLMDEPHAALGPAELDAFMATFGEALAPTATVVMVTHSLRVALAMDEVFMLDPDARKIRGPLGRAEVEAFFSETA